MGAELDRLIQDPGTTGERGRGTRKPQNPARARHPIARPVDDERGRLARKTPGARARAAAKKAGGACESAFWFIAMFVRLLVRR